MQGNIDTELLRAILEASEEQRRKALAVLQGQDKGAAGKGSPEPFLTLVQLAETLNFDPSTLWRWQIPGHRLGGKPRYLLSEVNAYLDIEEFQRRVEDLRRERALRRRRGSKPQGLQGATEGRS